MRKRGAGSPSDRCGGKEAQMERITTIARALVLLAVFLTALEGTTRAQSPSPPERQARPGTTSRASTAGRGERGQANQCPFTRPGLAAVHPDSPGSADRPRHGAAAGRGSESRAQRRPPARARVGGDAAAGRGPVPAVDQSGHELRFAHRQSPAVQRQHPVGSAECGLPRGGSPGRRGWYGEHSGRLSGRQHGDRNLRLPGEPPARAAARVREHRGSQPGLPAGDPGLQRAFARRGPARRGLAGPG